jgi:hypothetical protein
VGGSPLCFGGAGTRHDQMHDARMYIDVKRERGRAMAPSRCDGAWQECSPVCFGGAGTRRNQMHDARMYIDVNRERG